MKNIIKQLVLIFTASVALTACSDWADVDGITVTPPDISTQNPELYAKYLENLREYKDSEHKLVYAWFDNSEKVPFNRSHHLTDLPDSLDVISLMSSDNLAIWELEEMNKIRTEKGTKVITTIDFDAIKAVYNEMVQAAPEDEPISEDFESFLLENVQTQLDIVQKYKYDGICVAYNGKGKLHMTAAELAEYTQNERLFMGVMSDWQVRNPSALISYMGKPQNLIDKSFLSHYSLIILSQGLNATSSYLYSYYLGLAAEDGVPTDRFAMMASTTSLDLEDTKTGYFASGERSLPALADWASFDHSGIRIAGIGIHNISTDYYNPAMVYSYSRYAISTINPSIK